MLYLMSLIGYLIAWINKFGFENEFLGLFKNVNYKAKNAENYKTENSVSEFYGALGFKSELGYSNLEIIIN